MDVEKNGRKKYEFTQMGHDLFLKFCQYLLEIRPLPTSRAAAESRIQL